MNIFKVLNCIVMITFGLNAPIYINELLGNQGSIAAIIQKLSCELGLSFPAKYYLRVLSYSGAKKSIFQVKCVFCSVSIFFSEIISQALWW